MSNRYTVQELGHSSVCLTYKYGKYMEVQCNSSNGRTIIVNEITGDVKSQFDTIFGVGEYVKFSNKLVHHFREPNSNNPHSIRHTFIADYLPKLAKKDIKNSLPNEKNIDLIGKYFK